nr:molybdenum ABC transporter ATP-binding protein [uncultured Holophaga sp.]
MSGRILARFRKPLDTFRLEVDLDLPCQGITALFGHSGSGKTTLLRCIAGLERTPGFLSVNGDIWQEERRFVPVHRRPLGYVFQEASLFPHLSVRANLTYGRKRSSQELRVSLEKAVELLGIGHLMDRRPDRLSGGERQRVAIARALAVSPRLLLMDEPLAALDLARKQEILPYLERLHSELDIPVLYVSHSPDEVARLADHIVVLQDGQAIADGPLAATLARLDLPFRLGEDAGVVLEARVSQKDPQWHLARLDFPGGILWTRDTGLPEGQAVRVRILARDVSLALEPCDRSSILNILPARVEAMAPDQHPGQVLARLQAGPSVLIARLTERSVQALGIEVGQEVYAQVKSAALIE